MSLIKLASIGKIAGILLFYLLPSMAFAKEPTTIVYQSFIDKQVSFFVLTQGSLSERKDLEDAVEKSLSQYKVLKSYIVIPPNSGKLSAEDLKAVTDRITSESINTFFIIERTAKQGGQHCMTTGESTTSNYGIPELGQHTTGQAMTLCSADEEWAYSVTLRDIALNRVTAISEFKSEDLGLGDQFATMIGGKLTSKMVNRSRSDIRRQAE
jgi:hypothetical protein